MRDKMSLRLVTPPDSYPVTLDQVKAHLKVDFVDDDDLINGFIMAATSILDGKSGYLYRCLLSQTWVQYLDDSFPVSDGFIPLPLGPVTEVSSITYIDDDGEEQTVSPSVYDVCLSDGMDDAFVRLKINQSWPAARCQRRAASITFVTGYPDVASVPQGIKSAMMMMVAHWYRNREAVITGTIAETLPMTSEYLLAPFRRIAV